MEGGGGGVPAALASGSGRDGVPGLPPGSLPRLRLYGRDRRNSTEAHELRLSETRQNHDEGESTGS